jgi:hypothetical protein
MLPWISRPAPYSFPGRLSALRRRLCRMKISARGRAGVVCMSPSRRRGSDDAAMIIFLVGAGMVLLAIAGYPKW